jgi:lipopolysaccharide export system protein LptC
MQFVRDAWDRFLLYLPLAVMAALALGTYWLVHSNAPPSAPAAISPVRHEPDYFMRGFSVRTFDALGRLRTEVVGEQARHFPDTRLIEIDDIRIRSFDAQGRLTTASAQRGVTNEDTSEVQLIGRAIVIREAITGAMAVPKPRVEYRSEFLHAFMTTEKIKSHKPVELIRGKDRFSADALEYDHVERVLQLTGRVRGTLVPATK